MRIYEFVTQWVTLGVLFFLVDYATDWIKVVTLGGLVLGSLLLGFAATLLDRIGACIARALGGVREPKTIYYKQNPGPWPELVHKALVLGGVLGSAYGLSLLLPGYSMEVTGELVTFLMVYGLVTIFCGSLLEHQTMD